MRVGLSRLNSLGGVGSSMSDTIPTYPDDIDTYWWLKIQGRWEVVRIGKWSEKRLIAHTTNIRAMVILPDQFEYIWGGRVEPPKD